MEAHIGGDQNYGPFLGTLLIRCRIFMGTNKRTIIFNLPYTLADRSLGRASFGVAEGTVLDLFWGMGFEGKFWFTFEGLGLRVVFV